MARSQRRGHAVRDQKREEAVLRVAIWRKISAPEQIKCLDGRLGVGVGAVRQRERLNGKA